MTQLDVIDDTTGEVVGSVSDSGVNCEDPDFEEVVKAEVLDDGAVYALVPEWDENEDQHVDYFVEVTPGMDGFGVTFFADLPYPYVPKNPSRRSELPDPPTNVEK